MASPTIYDLLAQQDLSELTVANLDSAAKSTAISSTNIEFWAGLITISRAMAESRTYSHGLPIPELGALSTITLADGASGTIKPSGTEVWVLQNVSLDNCSAFLTDGTALQLLTLGGDTATVSGTVYLTNKVYIGFVNASGSEQTPGIAYQKVGM